MKKYLSTLLICVLTACLLFPALSAGNAGAADTQSGTIQIENRDDSGGAFVCDLKLSGSAVQGYVFAVLFAESGRMKTLSDYPAAEAVHVTLQDVDATDYVKILWVDETCSPIAVPVVLRMRGNQAAAYESFAQELAQTLALYPKADGASDVDNPYVLARLIVSCDKLPDLSAYHGKMIALAGPDNLYVLQFYNVRDAINCEKELQSNPSVRYVEPDAIIQTNEAQRNETGTDEIKNADAGDPLSWGVSKTGIDLYAESLRKAGVNNPVIVAVVDSGVQTDHPFLQERLTGGYDFVEEDDDPKDESGHGTHVAGIVADCTAGMNVTIMPVRVLDAFTSGSYINIANGIRYAVDHDANVINLSLGATRHSQTIDDAIRYALEKNVTVVIAAGNHNGDVQHFCPAHVEDAITVAAVDSDLKRFELSNYGEILDMSAPGVQINSSVLNGEYGLMSGTSMAAPHVSAAVALLMSERGTTQTYSQIFDLLHNATMDLGEPGKDLYFGAGFLNMRPFISHRIYALLYKDGEMVFQDNDTPDPTKDFREIYPVAARGEENGQRVAWYDQRTDIRTVTFADAIQPQSTAQWFYGCKNLSEIRGLDKLDTSAVTDMSQMFARCTSLETLNLAGWDTENVTDMRMMFFYCTNLKRITNITDLNTSNVTDMSNMFSNCSGLTVLDLSNFDTSSVTNMSHMFDGCSALSSLNVSGFDTSNVINSEHMFCKCAALKTLDVSTFQTSNIVNMENMFYQCSSLTELDVSGFDTSKVTNMNWMFYSCSSLTSLNVSGFNTFHVTTMRSMFNGCSALTAIDVSHFNTSHVVNMRGMFEDCSSLTVLDVSYFNTINVTDMSSAFSGCTALTALDVSGFKTSRVTNMSRMFSECSALVALDVSNFDTANVINMDWMFYSCSSVTALTVSEFNTSNVISMRSMFNGCSVLSALNVSKLNVSNVTNMRGMFENCPKLFDLDVSNFNTGNVENMERMFMNCSGLVRIYASNEFVTTSVVDSGSMFYNCTNLVGGNGTKVDDGPTDKTCARIDGGTSNPGYFTAKNS